MDPAGLALAFVSALAPGPLTPTPTDVTWQAPPECPNVVLLRRTIEHYAARGLDETGSLLSSTSGELEAQPDGYRLRLRIEVSGGTSVERVLEDPSCAVLTETAALMIAVTIDPNAVTRPPPEPVAPKPVAAPPPVVPVVAERAEPTRRSCDVGRSRLRTSPRDLRPCVGLEARVGMQLGILPRTVGAGIGADIAITWSRLRLELGASHWFRRAARSTDDPPTGGELGLTAGSLGVCARLGRRSFELPLCAGAELGAIHGRGVGIDEPRTERVPWAAAWLGPRAMWVAHPRLVLLGGVDLVVPLARYRFEIAGIGVVHRVDPIGGRFRVGLGVRI